MKNGKIYVAGIGPGCEDDITPAVKKAVSVSDVVVGYNYYFSFIQPFVMEGAECVDSGMRKEWDRAQMAFGYAEQGKTVCVISSGDAGIYGMAPLVWEMKRERGSEIEIEVLPGISAFQKAASLLGAPVGHDFCVISLSDLMTPWEKIEKRIEAAAAADFITAVYNPKSEGRYWQLYRLKEIFLQQRAGNTPVGYVRQAGRPEQEVTVTTLADFDPEQIDMFTVVLLGNSQSYNWQGKMITPRGYYQKMKHGDGGFVSKPGPDDRFGVEASRYPAGSQMGFIAYDTYHCRFRYGKYILCRRGGGGFDLPGFKRGESKDYRHGCHDGCFGNPERGTRTFRFGSEVLFGRSAGCRDGFPDEYYPYTSRYPAGYGRASRCTLCFR